MHDLRGFLRQPQDHVVILAAVKLPAEVSDLVQKFSGEYREVADVIVASERVRCIIRLEMRAKRVLRLLVKRILIRIDEVRVLFADGPHHLV